MDNAAQELSLTFTTLNNLKAIGRGAFVIARGEIAALRVQNHELRSEIEDLKTEILALRALIPESCVVP